MYNKVDPEELFGIFQKLTSSEKTTPGELIQGLTCVNNFLTKKKKTHFFYNIWFSSKNRYLYKQALQANSKITGFPDEVNSA